jgi:hypothetical protein
MSESLLTHFDTGTKCWICDEVVKEGQVACTLGTTVKRTWNDAEDKFDRGVDLDWGDQWLAHAECFTELRGRARRDNFRQWVHDNTVGTNRYTEEQFAEYIDESEHQDGYSYWLNFNTPQEWLEDFQAYWEAAES